MCVSSTVVLGFAICQNSHVSQVTTPFSNNPDDSTLGGNLGSGNTPNKTSCYYVRRFVWSASSKAGLDMSLEGVMGVLPWHLYHNAWQVLQLPVFRTETGWRVHSSMTPSPFTTLLFSFLICHFQITCPSLSTSNYSTFSDCYTSESQRRPT